MPPLAVRAYLIAYNAASLVAWAFINFALWAHYARGGSVAGAWAAVAAPLKVMQTAQLLEIAHAALGLVRSSPATTALQGARRAAPRRAAPRRRALTTRLLPQSSRGCSSCGA